MNDEYVCQFMINPRKYLKVDLWTNAPVMNEMYDKIVSLYQEYKKPLPIALAFR